jgi:hypothetical protein
MKIFKTLVATLASALLVSACGGGGSGTLTSPPPGGGGTGTTTTTSLVVTASPTTIASDGSTTSSIVATARDANNALVSGAIITFSAGAGGGIAPGSVTTDATGTATAKLSNVSAAGGSTIKVTATTGSISGSVNVSVVAIQQTLTVTTDSPQIKSDGSTPAVITALLRDANNNALPGVTVSFKSDSGGITVTQAVTDASGIAKASLSTAGDPTNRLITVTASAGTATPVTIGVYVAGTSLSLTGPSSLVLGGVGVYPVTLTDSGGKGIPNRTVTVSSANGNALNGTSFSTDVNGQVTVQLTGTVGGNDTLTASVLGLTKTSAIAVSTQSFTMSPAVPVNTTGTKVNLGVSQTITATWLNNGPQVGKTVSFTASRGTLSAPSAVTDANGVATVTISSNTAGPSIVAASATGVAAQTSLDFIATAPTQVTVQASPASVATQGTSTLTATVRDAANNLVEGTTVNFLLSDSTGGSLSPASAPTDAQGRAQTVYTAGSTTSSAGGVVVTAQVASAPSVSNTTNITVGGQTYFLSMGTGNSISALDAATYQITFVVLAVDAQGAAVSQVPVTMQVLPVFYYKGKRVYNGSFWGVVVSTSPETRCANEDTDYSGNITSLLNKDYNGNGKLDPGNVAAVSPSSVVTGADGRVLVNVTYPKDHADYVGVTLVASTKVNGTQSTTTSSFVLPALSDDVKDSSKAPPGPISPYGQGTTCLNPL